MLWLWQGLLPVERELHGHDAVPAGMFDRLHCWHSLRGGRAARAGSTRRQHVPVHEHVCGGANVPRVARVVRLRRDHRRCASTKLRFYGSSCANNGKDALNTPDASVLYYIIYPAKYAPRSPVSGRAPNRERLLLSETGHWIASEACDPPLGHSATPIPTPSK
eukprot:7031327-Pyramimonas_sp.AAC.2